MNQIDNNWELLDSNVISKISLLLYNEHDIFNLYLICNEWRKKLNSQRIDGLLWYNKCIDAFKKFSNYNFYKNNENSDNDNDNNDEFGSDNDNDNLDYNNERDNDKEGDNGNSGLNLLLSYKDHCIFNYWDIHDLDQAIECKSITWRQTYAYLMRNRTLSSDMLMFNEIAYRIIMTDKNRQFVNYLDVCAIIHDELIINGQNMSNVQQNTTIDNNPINLFNTKSYARIPSQKMYLGKVFVVVYKLIFIYLTFINHTCFT